MDQSPTVSVKAAAGVPGAVLRQARKIGAAMAADGATSRIQEGFLIQAKRFEDHVSVRIVELPSNLLGLRGSAGRWNHVAVTNYAVVGPRSRFAQTYKPAASAAAPQRVGYGYPLYTVNTYFGDDVGAHAYLHWWAEPVYTLGEYLVQATVGVRVPEAPAVTPPQLVPSGQSPTWSKPTAAQLCIIVSYPVKVAWTGTEGWLRSVVPGAQYFTTYQDREYVEEPPPFPLAWSDTYAPRWNVILPQQYPTPATELVGDSFYTLFQVVQMPEHQLGYFIDVGDPPKSGWDRYSPFMCRAAVPSLVLTRARLRRTTEQDTKQLYLSRSALSPVLGELKGSLSMPYLLDLEHAEQVPTSDWPEWFRPVPHNNLNGNFYLPQGDEAIDPNFPAEDMSGIEAFRPCVVGRIAATEVDGVIDYWTTVKTTDFYWEPVTRDHRAEGPLLPGTLAGVHVTRMGIMQVRHDTATGTITTSEVFRDVLGPDTCPQFDASMAADVAYAPHLLWAGVIDGKRCYAVRAVRYTRSRWLGSFIQYVDPNTWFSDNWQGYNRLTTPPAYEVDKGWGPYVHSTPEELWWFVDGVRQVFPLPTQFRLSQQTMQGGWEYAPDDTWTSYYLGARQNHMGMPPGSASVISEVGDYALEDYFAPVGASQQFAWLRDDKVVFALWPRDTSGGGWWATPTVKLYTFDGSGVAHLADVALPSPEGPLFPGGSKRWPNFALTCFQREVVGATGEVLSPAGLILCLTGDSFGYVLVSVDGGASWERRMEAPTSWPDVPPSLTYARPGVPGMGYHFVGAPGWTPPLGYPFTTKKETK